MHLKVMSYFVWVLMAGLALGSCQNSGDPVTGAFPRLNNENIRSLTKFIEENNDDPVAFDTRGIAFAQSGQYSRAIADFSQSIALDPSAHQAYANRALVWRQLERRDKALADYEAALRIKPDYSLALVGRSNIYRQMGKISLALADLNTAIRADFANARAFHNRGRVYQSLNRHLRAVDDFSTAIGLAPAATEPRIARAISYISIDEPKLALSDLEKVLKRDRRSAIAWAHKGMAHEMLGDYSASRSAYNRAMGIEPGLPMATEGLSRVTKAIAENNDVTG